MLFNSLEFLLFLPVVFILYWFVFSTHLKVQNFLVLVSSYLFYGWWDWKFLSLIFLSTIVDYIIGIKIHEANSNKIRRLYLWISIIFNLGVLGFFKYFNFFIESWISLLASVGYQVNSTWTLKIILPVGISFYTFQTMSYSLDIFRNKLKPTKDFISFASFVSFFPQLVAGPIERATHLLPQILTKRTFNYTNASEGLRLIIWGMFKKIVIADSLAPVVNQIFSNYEQYNGGVLLLGAFYFSFQIYCDFSGYSDIAIGTAKLFGFDLMTNFKFPYFSRNIGEFWRRWHISLSTWFRDYLYIPLGGSKHSQLNSLRNIFAIFIVSGFWHGANWTFIFWGLFHSLLYIPLFLMGSNRKHLSVNTETVYIPTITEIRQMIQTFILVLFAWIFFRSNSISESFHYISRIFTEFSFSIDLINPYNNQSILKDNIVLFSFIIVEFFIYNNFFKKYQKNVVLKTMAEIIIIVLIILNLKMNVSNSFIYFQF